jgi:copper homeostasis protein (lipoprotein)
MLPCSDCLGIRYQLNLLPDDAYMQRMTHLRDGHDDSYYDLGKWSLSTDGRTITLDGDGRSNANWIVKDSETLRKLDSPGNPIRSTTSSELKRSAKFDPIDPRLKMTGMFRYMADAPRFRECRSGLQWPVDMSEDYRALERAYGRQRPEPGADLLVSLKGRVESRPQVDASGTEATLIVEKFVVATPNEYCPGDRPRAGLENSRWALTRIGERAVVVTREQSEPWIELDSRSKRATGSGGCNRVSGPYEVDDGALRFGSLMSTKMACPGLDIETAFFRALDRTRRYHVSGRTLELMDDSGRLLARLEERNLR